VGKLVGLGIFPIRRRELSHVGIVRDVGIFGYVGQQRDVGFVRNVGFVGYVGQQRHVGKQRLHRRSQLG
jgi:hypothetical protein